MKNDKNKNNGLRDIGLFLFLNTSRSVTLVSHKSNGDMKAVSQLTFACSKLAIETLDKDVKDVVS